MSKKSKLIYDISLLQKNRKICDVLLFIAKENNGILDKINVVKQKLINMQPTDDIGAVDADERIFKLQKKLKKAMMKEIFQPYLTKTNPRLMQLEIEVESRGFTRNFDQMLCDPNDFVVEAGVLTAYKGNGGEVVLPNTVEVVNEKVFSANNNITRIVVNDGLARIKPNAFEMCSNLQEVVLSASVVSIEESAFYNCKLLTRVSIGEGLRLIGRYAFAKCPKLQEIYILDSITELGDKAFFLDWRLSKSIKKSIKKINKKALK